MSLGGKQYVDGSIQSVVFKEDRPVLIVSWTCLIDFKKITVYLLVRALLQRDLQQVQSQLLEKWGLLRLC